MLEQAAGSARTFLRPRTRATTHRLINQNLTPLEISRTYCGIPAGNREVRK